LRILFLPKRSTATSARLRCLTPRVYSLHQCQRAVPGDGRYLVRRTAGLGEADGDINRPAIGAYRTTGAGGMSERLAGGCKDWLASNATELN
jgi:hypothetical protein